MNTNNLHRLIDLLESLPEEQANPDCACDISACLVGWLPVLTGVMTNKLHEFLDVHPDVVQYVISCNLRHDEYGLHHKVVAINRLKELLT